MHDIVSPQEILKVKRGNYSQFNFMQLVFEKLTWWYIGRLNSHLRRWVNKKMNLFKERGCGMGQPKGRAAAWRQGDIVLMGGQLPEPGVSPHSSH